MAHYRTYSIEFKRAVVQQFLAGEISLLGLAKQHRVGRKLIRLWLVKYEAGEFNEEAAMAASLEEYEARIAMLERKVGQLTMENDVLKKTLPSSRSRSGGVTTQCHVVAGDADELTARTPHVGHQRLAEITLRQSCGDLLSPVAVNGEGVGLR